MFVFADTDRSGFISFEEFVACFMSFALDPGNDKEKKKDGGRKSTYGIPGGKGEGEDDGGEEDEEDEEEDIPEDLADLEPAEQQRRIKARAAGQMAAGTLLVLLFSDPMVEMLGAIGVRLTIPAFYISFVLAPVASNASELVSAINYAQKRTLKGMVTALSTLEGAAIMNNTFCLGIFLGLIYFCDLAWEFTAETVSIVAIQLVVALLVCGRTKQTIFDGLIILMCYPGALGIVWALENLVGLD
jgi:Ca2+/Na+ antiporter